MGCVAPRPRGRVARPGPGSRLLSPWWRREYKSVCGDREHHLGGIGVGMSGMPAPRAGEAISADATGCVCPPASGAGSRSLRRVHGCDGSTGPFRLVGHHAHELAPPRIEYRTVQPRLGCHARTGRICSTPGGTCHLDDVETLKRDQVIITNPPVRELMGVVLSLVADCFMKPGDSGFRFRAASLSIAPASFLAGGNGPLGALESRKRPGERLGVVDQIHAAGVVADRGEDCHPDVDPRCASCLRECRGCHSSPRDGRLPPPTAPANDQFAGFRAFEPAVDPNPDLPDTLYIETTVGAFAGAGQFPRSGVVRPLHRGEALGAFESRIARLLPRVEASEETRERFVEADQRPGRGPGPKAGQLGCPGCHPPQPADLVVERDAATLPAVRAPSLLQCGVVQVPLRPEQILDRLHLSCGRVQPVGHRPVVSHHRTSPLPHRRSMQTGCDNLARPVPTFGLSRL